jgi:hypothetical protein
MPTVASILTPLAVLVLLSPAATAAAQSPVASRASSPGPVTSVQPVAPKLAGPWTGTLRAGPIVARLRLTFAPGAQGRTGTAQVTPDGPHLELTGDIRNLVVSDREITFSVATQEGTMRFTGAPDGAASLKGQLTVVGDGGAVEARGVWAASAAPSRVGR